MNTNFMEKGASRYLIGEAKPFDQKDEMFKRPFWDPEVQGLRKRFYCDEVLPRDQPGYTLKDQALANASWYLDQCCFDYREKGGGANLYAWDWNGEFFFPRVPSGLKIPETDPNVITRIVKKAATYFVSSNGGVPAENDISRDFTHAIVIAIEMDYDGIMCSPSNPSSAAVGVGYSKMAFVAGLLARFIQGMGFKAIPSGNNIGLSIPMAIDAGLGEMARNGLLINPELGPRLRLAKVLTNLPMIPDRPIEFGVRDFCMICGKCAKKCPSRAIEFGPPHPRPHNISNRENVNTWHIDAEKCLTFWADNETDCSNCIRVCPFNKPPGMLHDMVRWGVRNVRWLDRVYLWGDDLLGYGKRKNAKYFWE